MKVAQIQSHPRNKPLLFEVRIPSNCVNMNHGPAAPTSQLETGHVQVSGREVDLSLFL